MTQPVIYSVQELTRKVKKWIEQQPELREVWVRGEISNFKHHNRGHMYFTLKDESSRVRAVMFRGNNQFLKFAPDSGMKVLARGEINVYERDGQYQFYVREMQPDGIGALYQAFEDLKKKLEQRGWFDQRAKKDIPAVPAKIGVITSPTGAAIRDILTTIQRRFPIAEVNILPVLVQGEQAPASIARAIEQAHQENFDVLIVGRGGGSIEELWAFNEEVVAEAIYHARIPVISAIGHETDYTIADFVADLRAPTPTAAAELAVPVLHELKGHVNRLQQALHRSIHAHLETNQRELNRLRNSYAFKYPQQLLHQKEQQLDQTLIRLQKGMGRYVNQQRNRFVTQNQRLLQVHPQSQLKQSHKQLEYVTSRLQREIGLILQKKRYELRMHLKQLDALSPLKTMQKGYSLIYDPHQDELYQSVREIEPGQAIRVKMHDGQLDCNVWSIKEGKEQYE